ncbi:hypothetical protein EI94DRAFT_210962 [Lactarius quietus]|nr:hypothetical protein EI94DRAFT_210962 [Lactarius quietus]
MSHFVPLAVRAPQQSTSEVLAPSIVGLFVQGFQTGLVVSQLALWLNLERTESASIIALVAFVTTIGLLETGISFASAWQFYVRDFGQLIHPTWTELIHVVLSTLTAAPIQALFIWRCYHILKRRIYVIIPLVMALITSIVLSVWVTAYLFNRLTLYQAHPENYHPTATTIWWPFVAYLAVPAALDLVITNILLYSLTRILRRIHTKQLRGRITRFIVVVWQAAIPPGLCAIALVIKYIVFTETHPGQSQEWYGAIQAMLGKLYIQSLFYTLNNRMDFTRRPPVTSTLDPSTLDSARSPSQRRVFSVYFPEVGEC